MEKVTYEKEITALLVVDPYNDGPLRKPMTAFPTCLRS
jgi:hypothetical protein